MKPSIPKGTRDFSPPEMIRRNYIFDTVKQAFLRYGFLPLETPAMENFETLMGKYGEEGDRLIFKILNSGDYLKDVKADTLQAGDAKKLTPAISEKALRYDLTVPFARYVVQHQNEITFPFKRYQIQPVWRADRPQKGRYREFYQCDADVIGSNSLLNEVELVQLIDDVFTALTLPVTIKINNRKILSGIAEWIGEKDKIVLLTVAIDKLDKIGIEGVNKELHENGLSNAAIEKLQPLIAFKGSTNEKLVFLKELLKNVATGLTGIEEVTYIFNTVTALTAINAQLELDITLARGLNYYTGAIFEVKADVGSLGSSICGGGRYDDLTGIFGLPGLSGVGISFGADRIYDVLNELNLYPQSVSTSTKVLFVNFGKTEEMYCLNILQKLRRAGINAEIYPEAAKIKKQFDYANKKQIPFVIVVGSEEMLSHMLTLKNMATGEQSQLDVQAVINALNQ